MCLQLIVESDLAGHCHGWDGDTEFRLANGDIWRQSAYRFRKAYLCSPAIRVWGLGPLRWIELEGVPELLPVRRL